jgi:hypothetical protein
MSESNILVWLSITLRDCLDEKFSWTTLITNVSKNDTLQQVIFKQDDKVKDKNKKIMHYLGTEGCFIDEVGQICTHFVSSTFL